MTEGLDFPDRRRRPRLPTARRGTVTAGVVALLVGAGAGAGVALAATSGSSSGAQPAASVGSTSPSAGATGAPSPTPSTQTGQRAVASGGVVCESTAA